LVAGYSVSAYWVGLTIGRLSMGRLVEYLGAVRTVDFSCAADKWTDNLVVATRSDVKPAVDRFALAAIFPATIWLMPRVPATVVPAAVAL